MNALNLTMTFVNVKFEEDLSSVNDNLVLDSCS